MPKGLAEPLAQCPFVLRPTLPPCASRCAPPRPQSLLKAPSDRLDSRAPTSICEGPADLQGVLELETSRGLCKNPSLKINACMLSISTPPLFFHDRFLATWGF